MIFTVLLVLATSLQTARSAVFESDLWPGEGIPVFEAVATQLSLHESPSSSSKVIRQLTVRAKQRLTFDQTRYRTISAGRLHVLAQTTIRGRILGNVTRLSKDDYYSSKFPDDVVNVGPGDNVDFLQYRAEGTCFVRVAGKTIDAQLCPTYHKEFRLDTEPVTEWWIHLTVGGKPIGWLLVTDAVVRLVNRRG